MYVLSCGRRGAGKQHQIMTEKKVDHNAMLVRSTAPGVQIGQRGNPPLHQFSPSSEALISAPDYTYVLAQTVPSTAPSYLKGCFSLSLTLRRVTRTRVSQTYRTLRHGTARWRETSCHSCRRLQSSDSGQEPVSSHGRRVSVTCSMECLARL
jgi:hypothetical protein